MRKNIAILCYANVALSQPFNIRLFLKCVMKKWKKKTEKKMMSRRIANLSQVNGIINLFRSTCELVYFCWLMHFSLSKDTEPVIFHDRNPRPTRLDLCFYQLIYFIWILKFFKYVKMCVLYTSPFWIIQQILS